MEGAFDPKSVLNNPNWPNLLNQLNSLPTSSNLIKFLQLFEAQTGYKIVLGPAGGGTYGNSVSHQIVIDGSLLPVGKDAKGNPIGTATTAQLQTIEDILTHELAHFVDEPASLQHWVLEADPDTAATKELQNEAIAYVDEYVGDQQSKLRWSLAPNTKGQDLKTILDGLAAKDGGYTTPQFKTDALAAAQDWTQFANPSPAPHLLYPEFAKDQWALNLACESVNSIDWSQVQSGQISIQTDTKNNRLTITTSAPLHIPNSTNTVTINETFELSSLNRVSGNCQVTSGTTPIGTTTATTQSNGTTSITITGQVDAGAYNANVALNSRPNGTAPPVSFLGDGNTLSNAQVNDLFYLDLLGNNNTVQLQYAGQLLAHGANNVITIRGDTVPGSTIIQGPQFGVWLGGLSNTVNMVNMSHGYVITLSGFTETVNGSSGEIDTVVGLETSGTVNGSGDTIVENGADLLSINGNNNKITFAAAASANLSGTGDTVTGSNSILTLGANSSATVTGTGNTVTLGTSDTLTFGASSSATITGNGAVINASTNQVTDNGNGFNAVSGTMRLSDNNIYRNLANAFAGAGTYVTFGNNHVAGNTGSEALPAPTAPK